MYNASMTQLESYAAEGYRSDKTTSQKQFFQVISIDDNQLIYQAYTADGKLYDQATIIKDFETGQKTLQHSK